MSDTLTTHLGLTKPAVGASPDTWGSTWNANLGQLDTLLFSLSPIGAIAEFAGGVVPGGWFVCDGSAVSRTTYSDLFNAIGTTFGAGDGSTTFNVPDLRARITVGAGTANDGTTSITYTLGQKTGHYSVTIAQANLPNSPLNCISDGTHSHSYTLLAPAYATHTGLTGSEGPQNYSTFVMGAESAHTHTAQLGGGGQALDTSSPVLCLQRLIYAGPQAA